MGKRVKKKLLVKHLLEVKREEKVYEMIYAKDATSSVFQIISFMQNKELAIKTNIQGTTPHDISS
jgi:hypothetical protein